MFACFSWARVGWRLRDVVCCLGVCRGVHLVTEGNHESVTGERCAVARNPCPWLLRGACVGVEACVCVCVRACASLCFVD